MYRVAVCDDEPACLREISELAVMILNEMRVAHEVCRYDSVEALSRALFQEGAEIHLLLLDILMGQSEEGMRLAQRLRHNGNRVSIVLISVSTDFILSGYDVQAIKYIVKPVDPEELRRAVKYDYETNFRRRYLVTESWRGIALSGIFYLETTGKKMALYLDRGMDYFPGRITEALSVLPAESFCRCHQSFIVNLDNASRIARYQVQMKDGRQVPISKRYYKAVQDAFLASLDRRGK